MYAMTDSVSRAQTVVFRLGLRIRERREARGLTLRGLAARSGVSPSMISDIERGTKSPTISTLALLSTALDTPITELLEDSPAVPRRFFITRAVDRDVSVDRPSGTIREGLCASPRGSRVKFLRYTVPAQTMAGPFLAHASGTIEYVHVLSGAIRVVFGDDALHLKAGDSCSCVADAPHRFDNTDGNQEALMYLIIEGDLTS